MGEMILHRVRVSRRARNVCLRMSIQDGLQVVIPQGYDLRNIPRLLEKKRNWIETTERRFARQRIEFPSDPVATIPTQIVLPALHEIWRVFHVPEVGGGMILRQTEADVLTLSGNLGSGLVCRRALQRWLRCRAHETLIPWLHRISEVSNLPFGRAAVRLQKSRWGSCSRLRTISLNAKLLFLRPEVVRYLLIHELCHTVHMNHSHSYWGLVASLEPDFKRLDREIRHGMRSVPRWAF
ncbi:MAG: SprT family zinc-dependent metalloprotease [Verrucomicrobiota bacterium]